MPAKIQNFTIAAGDTVQVNFDLGPNNEGVSLLGSAIYWYVYAQDFGVPSGDPVIKKWIDNGLQIDDPTNLIFHANLLRPDTKGLLGNYYHEALVVDRNGNYDTVTTGMMTVQETQGASAGEIP